MSLAFLSQFSWRFLGSVICLFSESCESLVSDCGIASVSSVLLGQRESDFPFELKKDKIEGLLSAFLCFSLSFFTAEEDSFPSDLVCYIHAVSDSEISLSGIVLVTKIGTKWFGQYLAQGVLSRLPSLDQRRCTFPLICVLDSGSILQLKRCRYVSSPALG